jgi:anti-anti-sigma factor
MEPAVYVNSMNHVCYLRAQGHMTALYCADIKEYLNEKIQEDKELEEVVFDLSSCEYMDSTFMGLLVSLNKRLQRDIGKKLELQNPSSQCLSLLKNLGILKLLAILSEEISFPDRMEELEHHQDPDPRFILDSHEALMELNGKNHKEFSLLSQILKKQLDKDKQD